MTENTKLDFIKKEIANNDIVLFMKGTSTSPLCGFSASVVQILKTLDVPFKDIDVLRDPELRESIKIFSDWPTIPQLYIKGEFIRGCDIVRQMHQDGSLAQKIKNNK